MRGLAAAVLVALAACGGGSAADPAATTSLPSETAQVATASAKPAPTEPPAFVGEWQGVHHCQRIVDMLHAAGMDPQIPEAVVGNGLIPGVDDPAEIGDPARLCDAAIDVPHSHFFTSRGLFGSRDQNGQQVDDGMWTVVDGDTFALGDAEFNYTVTGDELRMQPVHVGTCPADPEAWCTEAWKLMVAMPGMAWIRRE